MRIIVALGVLATILVYFQLQATNKTIFPFFAHPVTSIFYEVSPWFVAWVLFEFSMYVGLFTVALGLDAFPSQWRRARYWKRLADWFFGFGTIATFAAGLDAFGYLVQEYFSTFKPSSVIDDFFLLGPIVLSLLLVLALVGPPSRTRGDEIPEADR